MHRGGALRRPFFMMKKLSILKRQLEAKDMYAATVTARSILQRKFSAKNAFSSEETLLFAILLYQMGHYGAAAGLIGTNDSRTIDRQTFGHHLRIFLDAGWYDIAAMILRRLDPETSEFQWYALEIDLATSKAGDRLTEIKTLLATNPNVTLRTVVKLILKYQWVLNDRGWLPSFLNEYSTYLTGDELASLLMLTDLSGSSDKCCVAPLLMLSSLEIHHIHHILARLCDLNKCEIVENVLSNAKLIARLRRLDSAKFFYMCFDLNVRLDRREKFNHLFKFWYQHKLPPKLPENAIEFLSIRQLRLVANLKSGLGIPTILRAIEELMLRSSLDVSSWNTIQEFIWEEIFGGHNPDLAVILACYDCLKTYQRHDEASSMLLSCWMSNQVNMPELSYRLGVDLLHRGVRSAAWHFYSEGFNLFVRDHVEKGKVLSSLSASKESSVLFIIGDQGVGDQIFFLWWLAQIDVPLNIRMMNVFVDQKVKDLDLNLPKRVTLSTFDSVSEHREFIPNSATLYMREFLAKMSGNFSIESSVYSVTGPRDLVETIRVGFSWSSPASKLSKYKSLLYGDLLELLSIPGVRWIDLQYYHNKFERPEYLARFAPDQSVDFWSSLVSLRTQLEGLDKVVTVSSVTAHLAGLCNVPCLVLVPRYRGRTWYWGNSNAGDSERVRKSAVYSSVWQIEYSSQNGISNKQLEVIQSWIVE